jgi:predicted ATPase
VRGERQIVLVSGEPGIGKSRLARELADHVRAEHGAVLIGRCDEEALIVYQPFIETLRGHFARSPEDFSNAMLGSIASDLARLLPELSTRRRLLDTRFRGDPEAARYRLFEAVASCLATIAQARPTLLILDDLQWADRASLLLLKHVLRSPRPARLLLVGTYRDTDLGRGNPLTELLADLRRARAYQRIALTGLAVSELTDSTRRGPSGTGAIANSPVASPTG